MIIVLVFGLVVITMIGTANALVVKDSEELLIDTETMLSEDVLIKDCGTLIMKNATLKMDPEVDWEMNVTVMDDGKLILEDAKLMTTKALGIYVLGSGSLISKSSVVAVTKIECNSIGVLNVKKSSIGLHEESVFNYAEIVVEDSTINVGIRISNSTLSSGGYQSSLRMQGNKHVEISNSTIGSGINISDSNISSKGSYSSNSSLTIKANNIAISNSIVGSKIDIVNSQINGNGSYRSSSFLNMEGNRISISNSEINSSSKMSRDVRANYHTYGGPYSFLKIHGIDSISVSDSRIGSDSVTSVSGVPCGDSSLTIEGNNSITLSNSTFRNDCDATRSTPSLEVKGKSVCVSDSKISNKGYASFLVIQGNNKLEISKTTITNFGGRWSDLYIKGDKSISIANLSVISCECGETELDIQGNSVSISSSTVNSSGGFSSLTIKGKKDISIENSTLNCKEGVIFQGPTELTNALINNTLVNTGKKTAAFEAVFAIVGLLIVYLIRRAKFKG